MALVGEMDPAELRKSSLPLLQVLVVGLRHKREGRNKVQANGAWQLRKITGAYQIPFPVGGLVKIAATKGQTHLIRAFSSGELWFMANQNCKLLLHPLSSIRGPAILLSDSSWYVNGEFFAIVLTSEGPVIVPYNRIRPWRTTTIEGSAANVG